jgi:hypothetical protein
MDRYCWRKYQPKVIGLAIKAHRGTGRGLLEAVYKVASVMCWNGPESPLPLNGRPQIRLLIRQSN